MSEELCGADPTENGYSHREEIRIHRQRISDLAAENARLLEALRKIADLDPVEWGKQGAWQANFIARAALEPKP